MVRVGPTSSYTKTEKRTTFRTTAPSDRLAAVRAMPRATPAWGSRVGPRYRLMVGLHWDSRQLEYAPKILPAERLMRNTTPIRSTSGFFRMFRSSSAPERTKKRMFTGLVQRSTRSISSSLVSQMLQKTVPVIMQTKSSEKPRCTGPMSNSSMDRPTVSRTKAMERLIRLEREWKYFSRALRAKPATAPRPRERRISQTGSTRTPIMSTWPFSRALAMPKETEKSTRPTASSMATTIRSRWVRGPSALYCLTTIRVAAGAVAAAMEPRVMAEAAEITSGRIKWRASRAASTTRVVITACKMPMVMAWRPMLLSWLSRNSLPITKAMKPRATWVTILKDSTSSRETKPIRGRPSRPKKKGPSRSPATR